MTRPLHFLVLTMFLSVCAAFAQVQSGPSMTIDYTVAAGKWTPYEHVLTEYFKAFPYMTDTSNLAENKKGFSVGFTTTEDKMLAGFRIGSIRSFAWGDGISPQNEQWAEVFLVKSNSTDLFGGFFFIHGTWFRMGLTAGISYNVVKMKVQRSVDLLAKVKEGKFMYVNPGNAQNRKNTIFCAIKLGLPIAIGRRHALCIEPYFAIPLWKVNTGEIRSQMIPNSTPAYDKDHYKGKLPYGGVRFSFCLGFQS